MPGHQRGRPPTPLEAPAWDLPWDGRPRGCKAQRVLGRSQDQEGQPDPGTMTTTVPALGTWTYGQFDRTRRWRDENPGPKPAGCSMKSKSKAWKAMPVSGVPRECAGSRTQPHTSAAVILWGQGDPGPEVSSAVSAPVTGSAAHTPAGRTASARGEQLSGSDGNREPEDGGYGRNPASLLSSI